MSLLDDALAASVAPALLCVWGEEVQQHPGGDADQARPIAAAFTPERPDRRHANHAGRTIGSASLEVSVDDAPGDNDAYLIRGELWQTDVVEPPIGGLHTVTLTRAEGAHTRPIGGGVR